MQAYIAVSGSIFGLIGVAHLLRLFIEDHPWSDPSFLGVNLALFFVCGGLAAWAGWLLASPRGHPPDNRSRGP